MLSSVVFSLFTSKKSSLLPSLLFVDLDNGTRSGGLIVMETAIHITSFCLQIDKLSFKMEWKKELESRNFSFRKDMLFAESKFNLFGSDGRLYVWRRSTEKLMGKNMKPTVKYGGGQVMDWQPYFYFY